MQNFGTNLEDYIHLLIPSIVRQFETTAKKDSEVRIQALKTIDVLCDDLKLTEFSSRIIHAIARTIDGNPNDKVCVIDLGIYMKLVRLILFFLIETGQYGSGHVDQVCLSNGHSLWDLHSAGGQGDGQT